MSASTPAAKARYLLDVNALIAAIWTDHAQHAVTDSWIQGKDLASCPLSELAFLRISTHPSALKSSMADARRLLQSFLAAHKVLFIPADMPALDSKAGKSAQVKDNYLADLAARHGLRFATLDTGIAHPAASLIG
jgi:toxin-antitoxin system PIN domain toxin